MSTPPMWSRSPLPGCSAKESVKPRRLPPPAWAWSTSHSSAVGFWTVSVLFPDGRLTDISHSPKSGAADPLQVHISKIAQATSKYMNIILAAKLLYALPEA